MKPNWREAPKWAQWLAMDDKGKWYWYEKKPRKSDWGGWLSAVDGYYESADLPWDKTLEQRPEANDEKIHS